MSEALFNVDQIRAEILVLESRLSMLRDQLGYVESHAQLTVPLNPSQFTHDANQQVLANHKNNRPLEPAEYRRYGRQMILPEIGLPGQLNLRRSSVLIVGLGGLGCPAAAYLAGAGVGTIGLLDGDVVDTSNLHRQILHTTAGVGQLKVDSAKESILRLNPNVQCATHPYHLMSITSVDVFERYDLILDCTDNPASRYLVSDTAVLTGKPLVTASALRTEGQLMVLNSPPNDLKGSDGGPCYRCVFPNPPPADTVIACGEGGILGPVVGVMGVLMALEAIKLLASPGKPKMRTTASMLLYSAYSSPSFRNVRLRGRRKGCMACSVDAKITRDTLATSGSIYYDTFCGTKSPVDLLSHTERITAKDAQTAQHNDSSPLILDVRDATQFGICHLENSINIPYALIESVSYDENRKASTDEHHEAELDILENLRARARDRPLHVICRYGNDSQLAVRRLKQLGFDNGGKRCIGDIKGGLHSWRQEVDPSWPEY